VLCVTHLPQIASLATAHFSVQKSVVANGRLPGERTVVTVQRLAGEERVEEVARMLGGTAATATQHAREMIHGRGRTPGRAQTRRGQGAAAARGA
jgi:DNA repair protein RecN (Recombination protein N)